MDMRVERGLAGLLAAGLVVGAMQAHADDKSGFYIGAGVGNTKVQDKIGAGEEGHVNFDSDDTSFKVLAGYDFIEYLGLELAYIDFGAPADNFNSVNIKANLQNATGWTAELVAQLPIGPVDLFAKGGVVSYKADFRAKFKGETGTIARDNQDGDEAVFGGGLTFNIGRVGIRGEYEYMDIVDGVDVWTLSAIWHL